MRIGLISDMAETGFGRVGRELSRRWLEAGHDLLILAINFDGREGAVKRALSKGADGEGVRQAFDSVALDPVLSRCIPAGLRGDGMGHNLTAALVDGTLGDGWEPERVVLIADPMASLYRQMTDDGALARVPTLNYVPIEGANLSVFWRCIWEYAVPVAMTRFGAAKIGRVLGRTDIPIVAHGISPAFYRITPKRPGCTVDSMAIHSKEEAKVAFGWQDRTVILRTDRFVARKAYPEYFEIIRRVIAERPEVLFVIHCATNDEGGIMAALLADLPGAYEDRGWKHSQVELTRSHDTFRGLSDERLNLLYNAADIYATPSYSEGFGLTIAEAAACGVPVVANDFGAIPEAVGPGGLLVPPLGLVRNAHGHEWAIVDVDTFTRTLMDLVDDAGLRVDLGAKGEAHVRCFDWDKAALDFLRLMEDERIWRR